MAVVVGVPGGSLEVAAVVGLTGEVDVASAGHAQRVLDQAISIDRLGAVVVDLSQVTFMDCRGVAVLVRALNTAGDRLVLRSPSPVVMRLLDLTDLRESFIIAG